MTQAVTKTGTMGDIIDVAGPYEVAPFGTELRDLAGRDPRVVAVTADMGRYSDLTPFQRAYPERFFNVGMAEQNAVMVGAGLAKTGKIAFVATYAAFMTRRALDFVAIACAHSRANVKLLGGSPGLINPYGATHQAIEDLTVMASIPDIVVVDPCDAVELRQVVRVAGSTPGTFYIRNLRGNVPIVLDADYRFEVGKARLLMDGTDIGIVATGFMTARALVAARRAAEAGLRCAVLHVPTLKPFDAGAVVELAGRVRQIITAENHLRVGGLGSRVVEAIFDAGIGSTPVDRIGLSDHFHDCGSQPWLEAKYGVDVDAITAAVLGRAR